MAGTIDFGPLTTANPLSGALDAFEAGRATGRKRRLDDAYRAYAADPSKGIAAITALDPKAGIALRADQRVQDKQDRREKALATYGKDAAAGRKEALATGDVELIGQINALDKQQRDAAKENAETLGRVAGALKALPYEERKPTLQTLKSDLVARGLTAEQIDAFDPTDAQIDTFTRQTLSVKDMLDQADKDRTFEANRKDADRNYNLNVDKFGEEKRSNRAREGNDAARLGLEGQRVGIARAELSLKGQEKAAKLTEGQAKDGFNAKRLRAANSIMSQLESQNTFNPTMTGAGKALGYVGGGAVSRQYESAKEEWADSIIRLTTGAAATKPEIESAKRAYFPSIGDPPSVVRQKAASRQRIEQDAMSRAGPGARGGSADAPPQQPGSGQRPPLSSFQR